MAKVLRYFKYLISPIVKQRKIIVAILPSVEKTILFEICIGEN